MRGAPSQQQIADEVAYDALESDDILRAAAAAALVALTEHHIPPDVQELLVYGNPDYGIRPGALSKAICAVLRSVAK